MTPQPDSIDLVADPAFVAGIEDLPFADLRDRWHLAGTVLSKVSASLEAIDAQLDDRASADDQHATNRDAGRAASAEMHAGGAEATRQRHNLPESQGGEDRPLRTAADVMRDRDAVRRVYDVLGDEIGRRYRLGLTSVDEMLQD